MAEKEDDDKAKMMMMRRATLGCAFWCHCPLITVQVEQTKKAEENLLSDSMLHLVLLACSESCTFCVSA